MDLNFTDDEQAFRAEVRQWVAEHLPADISAKVHAALRLTRDDLQRWAKILGAKAGSAGAGRPSSAGRAGTPSSATCSKRNVRWPVRPASSPSGR